jgi:ABC-2 type transport system permease protein
LSKYFSILRINWINALEYRANALIGLFAILSGLFIEYQIWSLIFSSNNQTTISMAGASNPYNFNQLIVFIFLSIIVGQLKSSWVTSSQMILEIRQGLINKYLIRPISYFWYHFMMFVGVNSLYIIVYFSLLFLFVFIFPGMLFQTLASFLGFIFSLLLSIYLSYCIYFIMVCFAFWFGEVRSIVVAYNLGMLMISGQYIPIRLFPEEVLSVINYTPIPYLVDFPVSIATGLIQSYDWVYSIQYAILWCFILTVISLLIYNFGIRKYEAYGQ